MKTSLRIALSVVGLVPYVAVAGCSAGNSPAPSASVVSQEAGTSASPPTETAEALTPSPAGTSAQETKTIAGVTVPTGWGQGKDWTDTNASRVYGLKSGVAVFSGVQSSPATLSSYDKEGKLVSKSSPAKGLGSLNSSEVYASYAGGKPYLILVQVGLMPDPPGTGGVYYSVMDALTGRIIHEKLYDVGVDRDVEIDFDDSSVSFRVLGTDGLVDAYVINPVSGAVDKTGETDGRRWMARVDGVDIFLDQDVEMIKNLGVSSKGWSIPGASVDSVSGSREDVRPLVWGRYINLATEANTCMVIDVHTGKEAPFSVQNTDLCMTDHESPILEETDARLYFDVLPMTDSNRMRSYLNPKTGKLVKVTDGDTFVGAFTGGDGAVYGVSSAVTSEMLPAKLDLSEGKPMSLGATPETGLINAASGDGVIAIPTSDSPSNTEHLFVAK